MTTSSKSRTRRSVCAATMVLVALGARGGLNSVEAQVMDTLAAVSAAMSNPISSLIIFQSQFQWTQYKPPTDWMTPPGVEYPSDGEVGYQYQFILTAPAPLGSKINLISRLGVPITGAPISSELGDVMAMASTTDNIVWSDLPTIADPTQRTWGLGDLWYLGLLAPSAPIDWGSGTMLVAAGPSLMMPTATEDVVGLGKWSGGAGGLFGWTSPKGMLAVLGMQFWSFAGDENRSDVSLMSLQAFYYYNLNEKWSIGASPMAQFNWESSSGNGTTFPIGLGITNTSFWGPLPVRVGLEAQYAVIHANDIPGSRWGLKLSIIPVIPAPWGALAKALRGDN